MEWLLLLPKPGFLPQITHILDIWRSFLSSVARGESAIVCRSGVVCDKGSPGGGSGPGPRGAVG